MYIFEETKSYRPFNAPWAMKMAEEQIIDLYWERHQLDLSDDIRQFHMVDGLKTADVSHTANANLLSKILSVFTQSDVAAGELYCRLLPHVKNNEIRNLFMQNAAKEGTHQRCYATAVEELGFPDSTWTEFMEYSEMQNKIDLISGDDADLSDPLNFGKTLTRLLLAEGIALFGAFASMLNFKRFGLMMGTNKINEWSLRDEEQHVAGNILALQDVKEYLDPQRVLELDQFGQHMIQEYRNAEHKFIDLAYEMGPQQDMTADEAKGYIDYLGDYRANQLGFSPIFGASENPLSWMDWLLSGRKHMNFFEGRVSDYDHSGLEGEIDYSKYASI